MRSAPQLKVLVLPSTFPRDTSDPRGVFYKDQATAIAKAGADVTVLAPIMHPLNRLPCPIGQFQNISNGTLDGFRLYLREFAGWFPKLPYGNLCLWILKANQLFADFRAAHGMPDIVHAHCSINAGYIASIWKRKYKVPVVLTEHSTAFARDLVPGWQISLARKAFRTADSRMGVSEAQADFMNLRYPSDGEWIHLPNTLSPQFTDTTPAIRPAQPKVFTFLAIGLLKPVKGHELLIKAFHKYFKESRDVKVVIGGEGPERENLARLSTTLGIADRVHLLGNLTRKEVLQQMDAASAFILPSHYETFGVVLTEALSRGLPVISTKCGGPNRNVTSDNGYLVPVDDVDALGLKMLDMINEYPRFNQSSIRENACSTFGPEAIGRRLVEIYSEIVFVGDRKPE